MSHKISIKIIILSFADSCNGDSGKLDVDIALTFMNFSFFFSISPISSHHRQCLVSRVSLIFIDPQVDL